MSALEKLNFGQDSAESEAKNLKYIFLSAPFFNRLKNTQKWLVLGRKGSGKTAACLMLFEQLKKNSEVSLITPKSLSVAKSVLLDKASINEEESAIQKWKYVFLLEASRYVIASAENKFGKNYLTWDKSLQSVRNFLVQNDKYEANTADKALKFIRSIKKFAVGVLKVEGSIEIETNPEAFDLNDDLENISLAIEVAAKIVNEKDLYLLIDQVDDLWDSSKEGQNLIIGLLRGTKQLNDQAIFLKIIVFLRSDIFSFLRFHDSDKYRGHTEFISWNAENLKKLIALRIYKSTGARGDVESLWLSVFPEKFNGKDTFDYLLNFVLMRPRDLIQLCNLCRDRGMDRMGEKISVSDIQQAIKQHSTWKTQDLISEYYIQYPFLETVFLTIFYAADSPIFTREKIESLFSVNKQQIIQKYGNQFFEPLDVLLQILFSIGFLGVLQNDNMLYEFLGDQVILPFANLFVVNEAFREHLRIRETSYKAKLEGQGAIAQGDGAKSVGAGGIMIGGNVSGNIVIENNNQPRDKKIK
jgi:hypothetical protein